jgi:predicted nucleotidyltransferase
MSRKSLISELIEDKNLDKKIVKSFHSKDTLCMDIFNKKDDGYSLKEDIGKKLQDIANKFIEFLGVEFFIHDIILTGSLANYNWSEFSDVDLHIVLDMDEFDGKENSDSVILHKIVKEFFDAKEKAWKSKHNIKIKGFDVEIYPQDINEEHISTGVYSILHNKWLIEPKKIKSAFDLDEKLIIDKAEEYVISIDNLISKQKNEDILNQVSILYKKLKNFRQSGLESGGEYSYENLTFKLLRRNGYIEKLINLKNQVTDKKLSITQQ